VGKSLPLSLSGSQPIHARHVPVESQHVERSVTTHLDQSLSESGFSGWYGFSLPAQASRCSGEHVASRIVVVGNQHMLQAISGAAYCNDLTVSNLKPEFAALSRLAVHIHLSAHQMNEKRLVADTLYGIRRTLGIAQTRKKPLTRDSIVKLLGVLEGPIVAARDKALLLFGFAGSQQRSELAALEVEHLTWHRNGITLAIPRSKTDQEGQGREVEILLGVHDLT
jgi:hypothetical protein